MPRQGPVWLIALYTVYSLAAAPALPAQEHAVPYALAGNGLRPWVAPDVEAHALLVELMERQGMAASASRIFSPAIFAESLRLLFTSQRTTAGEETGYGMNWQIRTSVRGRRTYSHGDLSIGDTFTLVVYPGEWVIVAMHANLTGASCGDLADRIADLFIRAAPATVATTPGRWR